MRAVFYESQRIYVHLAQASPQVWRASNNNLFNAVRLNYEVTDGYHIN